jgi:hypothetical protein
MEKIDIYFETGAFENFSALKDGADLFTAQLAVKYYNQLFRFPPEHWGRVRRELGKDTFVSDRHCPFEIKGWIEETAPLRTLHILKFAIRNKHTK